MGIIAGLIAKIRADRKGQVGSATAATLGVIYAIVAAGYMDSALVVSFGHAALRMIQILRSPNIILDHHHLHSALGHDDMEPLAVPESMYRLSWAFNRINTDLVLPPLVHVLRQCCTATPLRLKRHSQWLVTSLLVVLAGMPFTPLYQMEELFVTQLLHTQPYLAASLMVFIIIASTGLIWLIMKKVLTADRFLHKIYQPLGHAKGDADTPFQDTPDQDLALPSGHAKKDAEASLQDTPDQDQTKPDVVTPLQGIDSR